MAFRMRAPKARGIKGSGCLMLPKVVRSKNYFCKYCTRKYNSKLSSRCLHFCEQKEWPPYLNLKPVGHDCCYTHKFKFKCAFSNHRHFLLHGVRILDREDYK